MPKVTSHAAAKEWRCERCPEPILPGQRFFQWSFRYGGTHRQHEEHGPPRQSQLTQSKMGDVYAAQEVYYDLGPDANWGDKAGSMRDLIDVVQQVADEYQEAAEAFGYAGENQERYELLEEWVGSLESAADALEAAADAASEAEDAESILSECPL